MCRFFGYFLEEECPCECLYYEDCKKYEEEL
jgi:hypothetical protein